MAQLDQRTYDLLFDIQRSIRYHMRRRRFYELPNTMSVVVAAVGGTVAATAFIVEVAVAWLPALISGVVGLVSTINLAIATGRNANDHGDLARQFIVLEAEFAHGQDLTDDKHEALTKEKLRIERSEPPILRLLDMMCYYEILRSFGDRRSYPPIPWWRRFLANCWSQTSYAVALAQTVTNEE